MGLQAFLRSGNLIPTHDLRKLIEILGKMFTDAHTKVRNTCHAYQLSLCLRSIHFLMI